MEEDRKEETQREEEEEDKKCEESGARRTRIRQIRRIIDNRICKIAFVCFP